VHRAGPWATDDAAKSGRSAQMPPLAQGLHFKRSGMRTCPRMHRCAVHGADCHRIGSPAAHSGQFAFLKRPPCSAKSNLGHLSELRCRYAALRNFCSAPSLVALASHSMA
jgi:hypothetical protein